MKVLICPDSFKGTFSAFKIAEFIESGVKAHNSGIECVKVPMADGGDGTIDALSHSLGGKIVKLKVRGPLGNKVTAKYLLHNNCAIVEMAESSGLHLLKKSELNPFLTTTYGVGQLIKDALDHGVSKIIVCIGGSATNDGGIGMAQALGIKFYEDEKEIEFRKPEGYSGGSLRYLKRIDTSHLDKRIKNIQITVLSDVSNPLYGKEGAAYTYGGQKGASDADIKKLDNYLKNFGAVVSRDLKIDLSFPGAGAAGGLGAGLASFLAAKILPGIDEIIRITDLESQIKSSDLIITGEGCLDHQSLNNKAAIGIAKLANKYHKTIIAIYGCSGAGFNNCKNYFSDCINVTENKPQNIKITPQLIKSKIKCLISQKYS